MIRFNPVRLADKQTIESYTLPSGIDNCDLAFANMFCWEFKYRSAWAEQEGFLLIRFQIDGGERIGYMQPVGRGDFSHLIPLLREDAHAHGQRLRIIGLTDEGVAAIRTAHPGQFAFDSDRDMEDYLYRADDLRTLTGRRYQPKRNHINRFEAEHPDYRYEPLTRDRFAECQRLEALWRRSHEGRTYELSAEQRAMQRAFDHFEELGLRGGCILVGDRLVAFTYGSAVNEHTFCTHVEKADTEFDGAFTIINKRFAEQLPPQYTSSTARRIWASPACATRNSPTTPPRCSTSSPQSTSIPTNWDAKSCGKAASGTTTPLSTASSSPITAAAGCSPSRKTDASSRCSTCCLSAPNWAAPPTFTA